MTIEETKKEIKQLIFKHIDKKKFSVYLFGSRATNQARKQSDFDIGILGDTQLPAMIQANIEQELEDSDIPYIVEVVDLKTTSDEFRQHALKEAEVWHLHKK